MADDTRKWWDVLKTLAPFADGVPCLLSGPPGTGKTHAAMEALKAVGCERIAVLACSGDAASAELRGHGAPGPDGWSYHVGPALTADGIIVDDLHEAGPDLTGTLLALFGGHAMTCSDGQSRKGPSRIIATMNGEPGILPAPLLDRLAFRINADVPCPAMFAHVAPMVGSKPERIADHVASGASSPRAWRALGAMLTSGASLSDAGNALFGPAWQGISDALALR